MDKNAKKPTVTVGYNQVMRSVIAKNAEIVYVAADTDSDMLAHIRSKCAEKGVKTEFVKSKAELGKIAGIEVPAAVMAILK